MMWKTGPQPDQIVDEDGEHVGFTDAGWAAQIIKTHNAVVESLIRSADIPETLSSAQYIAQHKAHDL